MEYTEKCNRLLSKWNAAAVVERSIRDILKAFLFSTNEVADGCSSSEVYLLTIEKKIISMINLLELHRLFFILIAIVM